MIKVLAELASGVAFPLSLQRAAILLCPPWTYSLCTWIPGALPLITDTRSVSQGPNLNYFLEGPISKHSYVGSSRFSIQI